MKRLILLATMMVAVLASCEKHEIRNEVLTEIGFTSNVGKQTRAIVDNTTYPTTQPFAVLAYSHQETTVTRVMNNVEIRKMNETDWKASSGTYYWPNDASTTMNFYAYSPAIYVTKPNDIENHMKMNGTITAAEGTDPNGINITGYVHSNMYVDFMVANEVIGAKYSDQNGNADGTADVVPAVFNHKMTQILFNVKLNAAYSGITFTLKSITLNNIENQGTVTDGNMAVTNNSTKTNYTVFPAKATTDDNGAPGLASDQSGALVLSTAETGYTTSGIIPVTMIPQTITNTTANATGNKSITVQYSISGTGVATETVTKTIDLPSSIQWVANKKVIYALTIGMQEIKFKPSVIAWDDVDGDGLNNPNDDPAENEGPESVTIPVV